jgi:Fe-S-cluster containining protein
MSDSPSSSPASWTDRELADRWQRLLETLAGPEASGLSLKRVRFQAEQSPVFQGTVAQWGELDADQRVEAWERLIDDCRQSVTEPLPVCVRCGECCRQSSPTLAIDDLELLREDKIPLSELVTLRHGEPARAPGTGQPFYLEGELIKVREKPGTTECVFLDPESDGCRIYPDRPLQCRAQACWEEEAPEILTDDGRLTRRDVFGGVEALLEVIDEHDRRCSFERVREVFEALKQSRGQAVDQVIDVLAFDDHAREFCAENLPLPPAALDLVFGRSLSARAPLFGFRVEVAADGTRTLLPAKEP